MCYQIVATILNTEWCCLYKYEIESQQHNLAEMKWDFLMIMLSTRIINRLWLSNNFFIFLFIEAMIHLLIYIIYLECKVLEYNSNINNYTKYLQISLSYHSTGVCYLQWYNSCESVSIVFQEGYSPFKFSTVFRIMAQVTASKHLNE